MFSRAQNMCMSTKIRANDFAPAVSDYCVWFGGRGFHVVRTWLSVDILGKETACRSDSPVQISRVKQCRFAGVRCVACGRCGESIGAVFMRAKTHNVHTTHLHESREGGSHFAIPVGSIDSSNRCPQPPATAVHAPASSAFRCPVSWATSIRSRFFAKSYQMKLW